ncbi:hypothetical protein ACFXPQ_05615 [Streptomyces lydicus]|uniref:hypothetical protein n=1 Tax=Streptomyces lydicus TaxID=47763 RepID=UPI0036AAA82B
MKFTAPNGSAPRVAMYLRCYPRDIWQLTIHQDALADYARELGVPEPIVFMDNGFSSRVPLPALGSLVSSVESGVYDVVLVVGLFAFSLDGGSACEVVQRLQGAGCKVVEIPPPHSPQPADTCAA